MPERILVVDDEAEICLILKKYFTDHGYETITASSLHDAQNILSEENVDLLIIDLNLGDADGLDLVRSVSIEQEIPIIILSGRIDLMDKVIGLEVGADDYITKPFNNRELLAHVRSKLRRARKGHTAPKLSRGANVTFEGWNFDRIARRLIKPDGQELHLTTTEYQILDLLLANGNPVVTRETFSAEVFKRRDSGPQDTAVYLHINRLRNKLEQGGLARDIIKTVRGEGYVLTSVIVSA